MENGMMSGGSLQSLIEIVDWSELSSHCSTLREMKDQDTLPYHGRQTITGEPSSVASRNAAAPRCTKDKS